MRLAHRERHGDAKCDAEGRAGRTANHHDDEDQDVSTVHEDREAFALLDEAIDAVFAIAHDHDTDQNAMPVDAVLIVGVQAGDRLGHVQVYPRAGSQPANTTRRLVADAGRLLDLAAADGETPPQGGSPSHPTHGAPRGNGVPPPGFWKKTNRWKDAGCPVVLTFRASGAAGWCRRTAIARRPVGAGAGAA